jgi:hypothetical protein
MHYLLAALVCLFGFTRAASAQGRECPTGALTSGETIGASLELADCQVKDMVTGSSSAAPAKRYYLEAGEKAVFTFTVSATGYTPAVTVYTSLGRLVASNTAAAGTTTARVIINLPAGGYNIITFGSGTAAVGAFELKAAHELPRPCPVVDLPEDGARDGAFTASSCRFVDLNEFSVSTLNVAFYRYPMARRAVLTLDSDTALTRFSSVLVTQSGNGFPGGKQLTVSLVAGTYTVSVSSPDLGSFTVRTKVDDLRECARTPIDVGAEVTAKLESGGCRWLDEFVPSSDTTPVNLYGFTVDARTVVQIDQTSPAVDSYLALMTAQTRAGLASNDDASNTSSDSRILIHLIPGNYVVIATAYDETTLGDFTLKLTGDKPRTCGQPILTSGASADGRVPAEGCRVLDYVALSTLTDLVAPFRFDAAEATMLALKAEGATASTLRAVTEQGLEVVRQASDRNGAIPVEFRLPAGPIDILMTSTGATKPAFKLGAQTRAIPACPPTPLDLNAEIEGTIASGDCTVNELVNYVSAPAPAQRFQLQIAERGRLAIDLESSVFSPLLGVTNDKDELLGLVFATSPAKVTLGNPQAEVGTIRVFASSASAVLGAFKVRNVFTSSATEPASTGVDRADWQRSHERMATEPGRKRPAKLLQ